MPHRGSERYFESVWASLSEGLKKRVLAAVKKSIEARKADGEPTEVVVTALSDEHRSEVEWLVTAPEAPFTVSPGGTGSNTRPGIQLSEGMASYVEHHLVESKATP